MHVLPGQNPLPKKGLKPGKMAAKVKKVKPQKVALKPVVAQKTIPTMGDSILDLNLSNGDTTVADTVKFVQEGSVKSDLEDAVKYNAEDSVLYDAANSRVYLYHKAKVEYTNLTLTAEYIEIDLSKSVAYAKGIPDSTGKLRGKPVFTQGSEKYEANSMAYNFKSKRAKIQGVVTQQGEGYIHGESVKRTAENEMYINHAQYTTCNLEHPHFHIQANKIKVIPGNRLITGPFNIHFADIPTPFGFAFGIFPTPQTASSGIIVPTYGEAIDRGFFLRNGGYYWHINDYVDARFLADIYSKGSYGFSILSSYKKRYSFGGNVDFRYAYRKAGDDNLTPIGEDFWLQWSHLPETRGTSNFSASVNLGTSSYNQRNSFSTTNYLASSFSSNVAYSKTFPGTPFSLGINARQQQNVTTKQVDMDLPVFNFNMNRIFPFKRGSSAGKTWWEKIALSYSMQAQNTITNQKVSNPSINGYKLFDTLNPLNDSILPLEQKNFSALLERMKSGMRHTIPISTSFNLFKYLVVSPNFSYDEYWYAQRLDYNWKGGDVNRLNVDTIRQFSRAFNYNSSIALQTRMYGIFFVRKAGIEAIRHIFNPSVSVSYKPDLSDPKYGMSKDVQVDSLGKIERLSLFANTIYGGTPTRGKTGSIGISLSNTIEMKVKNKADTSGKEPFKKINLLDNLSASTSYNLAAESFQLSTINLLARTTLFGKLNINVNGIVDPYSYEAPVFDENGKQIIAQKRISTYAWKRNGGIGQLTTFNLAMSTSLNPKARDKKQLKRKTINPQEERELDFINANPDMYVDFNIPWNLNLSYNMTYSKTGFLKSVYMQSLSFSGDVNLTSKWKIGFSSGYDFINQTLVYPNINIYRDLHCWEMRFNWIPQGARGSYSIDINVKASVLQDLKLSRRRSWFDR
jgi:hypothetical protein